MTYKIEFLPRARKELLDAWDWYDDRWSDLGDRFMREIEKKLQQIEKTPERYTERRKGFRQTKINVFPYLINRIQKRKKIIAISSIFHTSRNPRKKYTGSK
ncbi:MAG: type II toxin-antitoxin system RelE/ParE family toxin [Puia sp.]|nr:type II toxin-antitoxin system RelE/ParE family toxin [Puia sp.]